MALKQGGHFHSVTVEDQKQFIRNRLLSGKFRLTKEIVTNICILTGFRSPKLGLSRLMHLQQQDKIPNFTYILSTLLCRELIPALQDLLPVLEENKINQTSIFTLQHKPLRYTKSYTFIFHKLRNCKDADISLWHLLSQTVSRGDKIALSITTKRSQYFLVLT